MSDSRDHVKRGGVTLNIPIGNKKRKRIVTKATTTTTTTTTTTNLIRKSWDNPCGTLQKGVPSILSGDIPFTMKHASSATSDRSQQDQKQSAKNNYLSKEECEEEFNDDVCLALPSDIILAIRSLKQNYSAATYDSDHHTEPITFVLKTMVNFTLNTFSNDAKENQVASAMASTGFDIELKSLCSSGKLRLIQLQGLNGEEDEAIFEMQDYLKAVSDIKLKMHRDASSYSSDESLIDLFILCVKKFPQTFVLEQDLLKEMARENRKRTSDNNYLLQQEDKWINCLVSKQLLLPRRLNTSVSDSAKEHRSYWFTLPKLGICASLIKEGRRRMIIKLKRATHKEVKRSSLEVSGLGRGRGGVGVMSGPFHVRDLLARGVAKVNNTANGQFIKLQREGL